MPKKKDVVFRRVRGRIVPIKVKKKELKRGAKIAGTGLAISAGGGLASRAALKGAKSKLKRASRAKTLSRSVLAQGTFGFDNDRAKAMKRAEKLSKIGDKLSKQSMKFTQAASISRIAASVLGGAVVTAGLERGAEALGFKETVEREAITAVGGQVASIAFMLGLGKFGARAKAIGAVKRLMVKGKVLKHGLKQKTFLLKAKKELPLF